MAYLELKKINKIYNKNNNSVQALKDIDLVVEKGDLLAIVGTSGSGKSSLLNIIGCIDNKYNGEYILDGIKMDTCNEKQLAIYRNKTFGFVLQYYGLLNNYSVFDNVKLPLVYAKKKGRKEKVEKILEKFKILDKMESTPTQLSGGQCQRVAIARALINEPDIILADEPTGALDKNTGQEIVDMLIKLNNEGKTVIIVTHDEKIASLCKKVIRLEYGEVYNEKSAL